MRNRIEQIFEENVEIPEVVQRKAEETFWAIRKDGMEAMKEKKCGSLIMNSKRKAVFAICLCAVLLLVTSVCGLSGKNHTGIADSSQTSESEDVMQAVQDLFTIKVYAAGMPDDSGEGFVSLENQEYIPLSLDGGAVAYVLCESEDGSIVYCINTNFLCEGEGIDCITYSINKGGFQIVEPKDSSSIVIDGEKYEGELFTGIGGEELEENEEPLTVANNYKSFTVSYDNQINDQTLISISGNTEGSIELLADSNSSLEDRVAVLEKLMKDVVITCTIQYADGTSVENQIVIGAGTIKSAGGDVIPENELMHETFVFRLQE